MDATIKELDLSTMFFRSTTAWCLLALLIATATTMTPGVSAAELPKPSEEEDNMRVSPDHMKCDTCAASVFHMHWKLKKAHKGEFTRRLRESEVLEIIDEACMPRTYATTYGIKNVNGTHHLSGDGLKWFSVQSPTVGTLQPGMWLTDQCRMTQGEVGEDVIYTLFRIYHVNKAIEKSDVAMFRHICIKMRKQCTQKEAWITYDTYEKEDDAVALVDDI